MGDSDRLHGSGPAHLPPEVAGLLQALRSPAGEDMILNQNLFVEAVLPGGVPTSLAPEVLEEYRRPFAEAEESRRPILAWPRQIPVDGEPADVAAIITRYSGWMAASPVPKLFINAEPGASLTGAARDFCRTWPNQTEITVPGTHVIQEDSSAQRAQALASRLPIRTPAPPRDPPGRP